MANIAIIEDETAIAEMYQFKLEQLGHEVRCAINGQEGLDLLKTFKPSLILLDLMMPVMSGVEMLQKIRATDWGKTVKVVILTNISEESAPPELRGLAVTRYVVKANYTPVQVASIADEVLANDEPKES
jgi:DNA-binding response OmpR family regulator